MGARAGQIGRQYTRVVVTAMKKRPSKRASRDRRARSHARMSGVGAAANVDTRASMPNSFAFFGGEAGTSPVFNDGSVQEYLLPLTTHRDGDEPKPDENPGWVGSIGAGLALTSGNSDTSCPDGSTSRICWLSM